MRAPSNTPLGHRSRVVGRSTSAPRMPSPTARKYCTTSSLVTPRRGNTTRSGLVTRTVRPPTSSSTGGVVAAAMRPNLARATLLGEQDGEDGARPLASRPPVPELERARRRGHVEPGEVAQPAQDGERAVGVAAARHV